MKKHRIVIDIAYGSEFQREVYQQALDAFLRVLQAQMKQTHRNNKVLFTATIDDDE